MNTVTSTPRVHPEGTGDIRTPRPQMTPEAQQIIAQQAIANSGTGSHFLQPPHAQPPQPVIPGRMVHNPQIVQGGQVVPDTMIHNTTGMVHIATPQQLAAQADNEKIARAVAARRSAINGVVPQRYFNQTPNTVAGNAQ